MRFSKLTILFIFLTLLTSTTGCEPRTPTSPAVQLNVAESANTKKTYQDIIVGYAQIGAESEWRTANTTSLKETA
jgi:hypothetical protein